MTGVNTGVIGITYLQSPPDPPSKRVMALLSS